eukprot:1456540-Alexandrium_andersonii.AAC.1
MAVMRLLRYTCDSDELHLLDRRRPEVAANWQRLVDLLPGDWQDASGMCHVCCLGCHSSREAAIDDIMLALDQCFLSTMPRIPALNRWTKLFQPASWWCIGSLIHGLFPAAFSSMYGLRA